MEELVVVEVVQKEHQLQEVHQMVEQDQLTLVEVVEEQVDDQVLKTMMVAQVVQE